jgi:hypothetical protein
MADLGKAFKRAAGAFADSFGPSEFAAGGKKILCDHCGASKFAEGSALLNTAGMTFAHLDWADTSAATLACTNCGKLQWFLKKPERIE